MERRKIRDFLGITNNERIFWSVTNHADHFRVIRIAGDHDVTTFGRGTFGESLHAGHERTCGVDDLGGATL